MKEIVKNIPDSGVIVIDGRCGAGKTTLAENLAKKLLCPVIHMDHFFLPRAMQCAGRENIHHERFSEEVIPNLGRAFSYRPWDCARQAMGEPIVIPQSRYTVVEGSYSMHPVFGKYYDYAIFLEISNECQLARLTQREGANVSMFREKWIPLEEAYFDAFSVRESADIVINGGER